jgi:hypothetical protein
VQLQENFIGALGRIDNVSVSFCQAFIFSLTNFVKHVLLRCRCITPKNVNGFIGVKQARIKDKGELNINYDSEVSDNHLLCTVYSLLTLTGLLFSV